MKQKTINIAKNIALVLLTLLMAALTVLIWFRSLSWEDIPVDSRIGQFYMRVAYGSASVFALRTEETPAAYPIEIAVRAGDQMVGVQNDETGVDALYEQFREDIEQALSIKNVVLEEGSEEAFLEALAGDCIYFRYPNALPAGLLLQWLGGNETASLDLSISAFLISSEGKVWVRNDRNELRYYVKSVDSSGWQEKIKDSVFQKCSFALQKQDLLPETLLFETRRQAYSAMDISTPAYLENNGINSLQTVLEAFAYSASTGNYMDGNTRIFVNNNSTLRVSSDGTIRFHATSLEGGIEAYRENEASPEGEQILRIAAAQSVLEQIQKSYTTEGTFYLYSVYHDAATDRYQLQFRYLCNGVPVMGDAGRCAVFEFKENTMVSAEITVRTFAANEQLVYLVPCAQLLQMANDGDRMISIGYFEKDGVLRPERYFESAV